MVVPEATFDIDADGDGDGPCTVALIAEVTFNKIVGDGDGPGTDIFTAEEQANRNRSTESTTLERCSSILDK